MEENTPTRPVGIDKGLKHRVVTSDGHYIPALVPDRRLIKRTSRSLNRAQRGSKSRLRKRQAHAKAWRRHQERAIQADFRLAHWFIQTYDAIVTEDLNVSGMLRGKWFSKKMYRAAMVRLRCDPRAQSLESWCEVREGEPCLHEY